MRTIVLTMITLATLVLTGCDDHQDRIVRVDDVVAPPVPQGVYSVTRDHQVLLYWMPIDDVNGDFSSYVVYRSDFDPDTGYYEIGETTNEYFVDNNVVNGRTYYYAVSSVDIHGNLSDLSYEYVFDSPRPQGINRTVFDFNILPNYAGWNLAAEANVSYQSDSCDFYLEYYAGDDVFYFNVGAVNTDIQDMGYTKNLDAIDYAPESGWSKNGWCEVILYHTYVIWTADNHFAKIRVVAINSDNVIFDWAYQVAPGNPELKPQPTRTADYLRHPDRQAHAPAAK